MEAKHDSTKYFVSKTGDKVTIELEVTGNPDEVISKLMKSARQNTEIFEGAKVNQIFFAGKDVDSIVQTMKEKIIIGVNNELLKFEEELTGRPHSDIVDI